MSIETVIPAVLAAVSPRVFPDVAPFSTPRPYITWQQIGGPVQPFVDGALADKEGAFIQVDVWADTRLEANALNRSVELLMSTTTSLQGRPLSARVASHDADTGRYGAQQDFEVWVPRTT